MRARWCFFLWSFLAERLEGRGLFPFTQHTPLFFYQRAFGKGDGGGVVVCLIPLEGAPSCFLMVVRAKETTSDPTGRTNWKVL